MSRHSVVLTANARADLRDIRRYTRATWGNQQSEVYELRLVARIRELGGSPLIGEERNEAPGNVRSLVVRRHVVYYEVEVERIVVLRILHERMDAVAQLRADEPP
jgi:toxin ParE1/3/4